MIYQATLTEAREAVDKIDKAVLAVQALADKEPQDFPSRPRIKGLREISRDLAKAEVKLRMLYE
jgi:hypothetical protein